MNRLLQRPREVHNLFGPRAQWIIFSALEGQRQNNGLYFREWSIKSRFFKFNYILFIACGLILMPPELFRSVTGCKIVNSSMKFKFVHKIFVIQRKFLVLLNLLRGPDITRSGAGSNPRTAGCAVHP